MAVNPEEDEDYVLYISEPELTSTKSKFTFFKAGDKVRLDPSEIKGSHSFEGAVDLKEIYTVLSVKPKEKRRSNPSNHQVLMLDKVVYEDEDLTGWSNSWFIPA